MKKFLLILALATFCGAATLAQATNYLPVDPSDPNSDHWYVSVADPAIEWHRFGGEPAFGYGTHHMIQFVSGAMVWHGVHLISSDDDGSVLVNGMSQDGGENYMFFDPPFPLVMAPLYVGRMWTWELEGFLSAEFECLAEEDIEACGSTYQSFEVRALETYPDGFVWEGHQWYSDGFGIVKFIWGGEEFILQCPVSVEQQSWSDLKVLFR
jgi:hypothetical protein